MGKIDLSPLAVSVQAVGTLLLTLVLAQLGRISSRRYARQWAIGWAMFFFALLAVRVYIEVGSRLLWPVYLLCQWSFLMLLWRGCRNGGGRPDHQRRSMTYLVPLAVMVSLVLMSVASTFNDLFVVEAAIVSFATGASFVALRHTPEARRRAGWQTMRFTLVLMSILYLAYVPLYAMDHDGPRVPLLEFSSLADLMVSVALGFGMILFTAEDANADLRDALSELAATRSRISLQLNIDPLTEALSRHAFHTMQKGDEVAPESLAGVVVMLDIDHLKSINDHYGHAAGDAAIRAAANAIRGRIRGDDLLFRWGGDEFVVIIPNLSADVVARRFEALSSGISAMNPSGGDLRFHVSWGAAEFGAERGTIESAMKSADEQMYRDRNERRRT